MRQVTALQPHGKAGVRRVNVFLDGEPAFTLAEELAARLSIGEQLSDAEVADFQHLDSLQRAYDAALALLSYRSRSTEELRRRLQRRAFDPGLVEEVIEKLQTQGMLDDAEFARSWVDSRQSRTPRGSKLLHAELRAKGIDREIIDDVLPGAEDEASAAYRAGKRKARALAGAEWVDFRRRLGEYLVRRGFSYATSAATARKLWEEMNALSSPPIDLSPDESSAASPDPLE